MYLPKKMPLEYEVIPLEDVVFLGIAKDGTLYGRKQSDTAQMVKSTDGGHTWENIVRVNLVDQILILDDDSILAWARGGAIHKSTDGGETAEIVFNTNPSGPSPGVAWMPTISLFLLLHTGVVKKDIYV